MYFLTSTIVEWIDVFSRKVPLGTECFRAALKRCGLYPQDLFSLRYFPERLPRFLLIRYGTLMCVLVNKIGCGQATNNGGHYKQ